MKSQQALESSRPGGQARPVFVEAEKLFEQMKEFSQSVAQRAYEFFDTRGREIGHDLEDWFQAESELLRRVPVEIMEADGHLKVRAEVPGFSAEQIKVSVEPRSLMISGQTETQTESSTERMIFTERRGNGFCRTLNLPAEVDPAQTTATVKDGVLELTLAKVAKSEPRSVEVKAA
jgi:HSP20 family protein